MMGVTADNPDSGRRSQVHCLLLLLAVTAVALLLSGCTTSGRDPVIGTWEWTDGGGYTERYTFNEDHSFSAEALGSAFVGTWNASGPGRYEITYRNRDNTGANETQTEQVLFDGRTDAIYFPAHYRVN